MRIHILGICGTFMGGLAALARELGDQVEGSDQNVYPPMSNQLETLGVKLHSGYHSEHLQPVPDLVVVGNAASRTNPAVEYMLNERMHYNSGPQWLGERVLPGRRVLAVAGTHGKTTTTSLLAWLIEANGQDPGFLVGGVPDNFGVSARLGSGDAFVVEADEYDTAFFDKRSKFVHYRPEVAILNNLEFDHADIFEDIAAIQKQFHHLVRTIPANGRLIVNGEDDRLTEVLKMGCWTPVERFSIADELSETENEWQARLLAADGSCFELIRRGKSVGIARWSLIGRHNVMNALAAIAAAEAIGINAEHTLPALASFLNAKRRLEKIAEVDSISVYDDFAHHPTAIATTLAGLRARAGSDRIIAVMEPRSNSMRLGAHAAQLAPSLRAADLVLFLHRPELAWDASSVTTALHGRGEAVPSVDALLERLRSLVRTGDHVVFMSNGGFENAPQRFAKMLAAQIKN